MIRIILLGRTGNHLFQYALGRCLAEKHDVPLVLDASWFDRSGWSEVSHFLRLPLRADIVRDPTPFSRALRKATGMHRWRFGRFPFLTEKPCDHSFDPSFLEAPADCALFGYFQSWRYFAHRQQNLRDELGVLLGVDHPDSSATERAHHATIAVHVRRGDFLRHPAFQVCGEDYYLKAMELMRRELSAAEFLIFSDDPPWCRRAFRGPDIRIVDSGPDATNPLHDLRLMSRADHHIISNSSYSWWAAWLGKKPGQRVITPERWFTRDIHAPMSDKLCDGWQTLDA